MVNSNQRNSPPCEGIFRIQLPGIPALHLDLPRLRFDYLKNDLGAGFVVFLVALPLCLGIALASNAPPLAGLITGVVAGLLVALLSGSELSVSGPAAGLTITIIATQQNLGSFEGLLIATILAGVTQIIFGLLRTGLLAAFFPSSVIKGMLAGIGIIISVKQIPLAIGWRGDFNPEDGIFCFLSPFCLHSFFSALPTHIEGISFGALLISAVSIWLILSWDTWRSAIPSLRSIPGPLVAVLGGIILNQIFLFLLPSLALSTEQGQLVSIPPIAGLSYFLSNGPSSFLSWLQMPAVWSSAFALALIASVETLLCLEATDKLDPMRRVSRPNRELIAQGIGNITVGFLGGIPMTSVIVRSSANVYAGGRTRLAGVFHGLFLLTSVLVMPEILNSIPLAALAAVLIVVGYKLTHISLWKQMWKDGYDQFLPFVVTVAGVVIFDLLTGVAIGTVVGLAVVLVMNHHAAFAVVQDESHFYIRFAKDVTFLQKIALKRTLAQLPSHSQIVIDGGGSMFIDHDIQELLSDFKDAAIIRDIRVEMRNMPALRFDLFAALSHTEK